MNPLQPEAVVVPVDFSEESLAAVDVALELPGNAKVFVVHVLPPLNVTEPGVIWDAVDDDSRIRHATDALRHKLADAKYAQLELEILIGDPGQRIAEFSQIHKAGLIITPSHGRTGLKRLLIGSVAERIVRLSHCPVLVLRS